jgi:predicted HicB family RNase H-like nuclease
MSAMHSILTAVTQDRKTHNLLVRVTPELRERLNRAAQTEQRSTSNLIRLILTEWLEEHDQ